MANFLSLIDGVKTLIFAITSSTGTIDANKIVATDFNGKIDNSLISSDIAKIKDITNQQQYGKFTGLKSSYYSLGGGATIIPIVGGQSGLQSYWGLQLGGLRPNHMYTNTYAEKEPAEIFPLESPDSFCVGIQAQTLNPDSVLAYGLGRDRTFSILNLYGTNWHINGHFFNCKNANYDSVFNINLNGDISIQGNKILGKRDTGWTISSGTQNKGAFDTSSATTQQCAERIKALEDMLRNHGLIN